MTSRIPNSEYGYIADFLDGIMINESGDDPRPAAMGN